MKSKLKWLWIVLLSAIGVAILLLWLAFDVSSWTWFEYVSPSLLALNLLLLIALVALHQRLRWRNMLVGKVAEDHDSSSGPAAVKE